MADWRMAVRVGLATAAAVCAAPASVAGAAELGELTQLAGTAGCLSGDGSADRCTATPRMGGVISVVISPDGRFAYASGTNAVNNILTLSRDPATGALSPIAGKDFCISEDGSAGASTDVCLDGRVIGRADEGNAIAMPKDGEFLYAGGERGIAVFSRDAATGKLTQLAGADGCITVESWDEDLNPCTHGRVVKWVDGITMSADERFVYVNASWDDSDPTSGLAVFSRDAASGKLTQLSGKPGCATTVGDSNLGPSTCLDVRGGGFSNSFAITPDSRHGYLAAYDNDSATNRDSLAILDIDPATGVLSQRAGIAGCVSKDGASLDGPGTCTNPGAVLDGAFNSLVSRDGRTLYVSAWDDHAISIFRIDADTGSLSRLSGTAHCVASSADVNEGPGLCTPGRAFGEQELMTLSADGRTLYATARSDGVQVLRVDPATGALTQLPGKAGCLTSDGASSAGPATCTDVRGDAPTHLVTLSADRGFAYFGNRDNGLVALSAQASPICANTAGSTAFATPFALGLSCSDPNGDPFTREIVSAPAHGSLAAIDQAAGTVAYSPLAGFSGGDAFTFRGVDATSASAPASAAIAVGAPPSGDTLAPVCKRAAAAISRRRPAVSVRCGEAASLRASLTLPRKSAKQLKLRRRIATGRASAAANASTKVKLKLTRKASKRLKRLSRAKLRRLRPVLKVTATDSAGNASTLTARVKLKR